MGLEQGCSTQPAQIWTLCVQVTSPVLGSCGWQLSVMRVCPLASFLREVFHVCGYSVASVAAAVERMSRAAVGGTGVCHTMGAAVTYYGSADRVGGCCVECSRHCRLVLLHVVQTILRAAARQSSPQHASVELQASLRCCCCQCSLPRAAAAGTAFISLLLHNSAAYICTARATHVCLKFWVLCFVWFCVVCQ